MERASLVLPPWTQRWPFNDRRVNLASEKQLTHQVGTAPTHNFDAFKRESMDELVFSAQALQGQAIDLQCQLDAAAAKFLNTAATRLGWSGRGIHRCLKVARTIADLAGAQAVQSAHVAKAVQYRRALKTSQ
ncbi:hypothetical protein [Polaromonas sp. OV174]|uniref:magnesium chelatase subunit ChlI family protein n=1 Tax=Polaromonas sp. OV174 TaxID=1855300 RepID=UPI0021016306|nr:hypothetical protein [Polaromonas sp. OV174]